MRKSKLSSTLAVCYFVVHEGDGCLDRMDATPPPRRHSGWPAGGGGGGGGTSRSSCAIKPNFPRVPVTPTALWKSVYCTPHATQHLTTLQRGRDARARHRARGGGGATVPLFIVFST